MTAYSSTEFRPVMIRARAVGRALLKVYGEDGEQTPAEFLDLLDIAEQRLADAGHPVTPGPSGRPQRG